MSAKLRILFYLIAGLVVIAVAGLAITYRIGEQRLQVAVERFEAEVGRLDLEAHAPEPVATADNAAARLRSGVAALDLTTEEWQAIAVYLAAELAQPPAAVEEALTRNEPALAELRRVGGLSQSNFEIDYSQGTGAFRNDEMINQLRGRKILATDARDALADGDRRRTLEDLRAIAAQRDALRREPSLAFQLMARAMDTGYHDLVQDLLLSPVADEALLNAAAEGLEVGEPDRSLASAFAMEALFLRWALENAPSSSWTDRLENLLARPYAAAGSFDLYRRMYGALEFPVTEMNGYVTGDEPFHPIFNPVAGILIPNLLDTLHKHRSANAARQLGMLAVELRLTALATGSYPEDLPPGLARPDLYAEGPLLYRREPDGSAVLSFPEAEALWLEQHPNSQENLYQPRFVWRLPVPRGNRA